MLYSLLYAGVRLLLEMLIVCGQPDSGLRAVWLTRLYVLFFTATRGRAFGCQHRLHA